MEKKCVVIAKEMDVLIPYVLLVEIVDYFKFSALLNLQSGALKKTVNNFKNRSNRKKSILITLLKK